MCRILFITLSNSKIVYLKGKKGKVVVVLKAYAGVDV
jgi:hypothetical protein